MALAGSLKEFSLADILQLIFFQKKTGILKLSGKKERVRVLFREGNITGAESNKRDIDMRLGKVMLKRNILSKDDLEYGIDKQKRSGGKLGAALVREGLVTIEQIHEVVSFQITETMGQLFSWKEGLYEFTPQSVPLDKEAGLSLDTQHFLMEGLRLVDEWSELGGKITIDTIYRRTNQHPEALEDEMAQVYEHVDGKTDVGSIADYLGRDSFSVSTSLLALGDQGYIEKLLSEEDIAKKPKKRKRKKKSIPVLMPLLTIAFLLALVASITFSNFNTLMYTHAYKASQDIDTLRYLVEANAHSNGEYPQAVEAIDAWGNPVYYERTETGYILLSPGPDGKPGTPDDIH